MIRIFMIDDHVLMRSGLGMLLDAQEDMQVVGEARSHADALQLLPECQPDVITLDIDLEAQNGLQLIAFVNQQFPNARCLVLTMHDEPTFFKRAVLEGAAGYVVKAAAEHELLTAIRTIHSGMTYFHVSVAAQPAVAAETASTQLPVATTFGLTDRERDVLALVASGHTSQEIGQQLFLSRKTIETYRARLMQKLGVSKRADLVKFAFQNGLLPSPTPQTSHAIHTNTTPTVL